MKMGYRTRATAYLVILSMVALFVGTAQAENEVKSTGFDWILSEDLDLTIQSNEGWKDYAYENVEEKIGTLYLGKEVTDFALSNEIVESGANGRIDPNKMDAGYWPELSPKHIAVEDGNQVFQVINGMLINMVTNTVVLAERNVNSTQIPNGIVTIGINAFKNSEVESVCFPDSLRNIQEEAFAFCYNLYNVTFGEGVTEIGKYAFNHCEKLRVIILPLTMISIGEGAFTVEKPDTKEFAVNTVLSLPERIEELSANAFQNRTFNILEFPNGLMIRGDKPDTGYKQETYCFYSIHTVVFRGNVYELQYGSICYADRLIFLGERPDGISSESIASKTLTVYYLDEFAAAWSPNGETEWNGWPIQQITRTEAEAMIAEASQPTPSPAAVLTETPAPPVQTPTSTAIPTATLEPEQASGINATMLVLGGAIVVVIVAIIVLAVRRGK